MVSYDFSNLSASRLFLHPADKDKMVGANATKRLPHLTGTMLRCVRSHPSLIEQLSARKPHANARTACPRSSDLRIAGDRSA
jgi:hypothetical protein